MRTPRISRWIHEHPWAILPERLETILAILDRHDAGIPLAEGERAAMLAATGRPTVQTVSSVAVIPLVGPLIPRADGLAEISGATSLASFSKAVRAALADPSISAIVLDVDSPGGSVFGVEEAGDVLASAKGQKPIVAVANPWAASAAYWLASQASEFVITPSGQVGSIGVLGVHDDVSKAAEQLGMKRTFVFAGRYKTEGNEFEPLGDPARAHMQGMVDAYYATFVQAVARGRGTSQKAVREGMGEGRMLLAAPALAAGMVDRIESFDVTLARLTAGKRPRAVAAEAPDRQRLALEHAALWRR